MKTNTIYNMDFRDGFEKIDLPDGKRLVIVTDPPYNINFSYNEYSDNLDDDEYIEMISWFQNYPLAIIHYPEETMRYFVPALGVPDEVNVWAYNSNLPSRQHRLINYYGLKPNYNNVLQPYKNPTDKRIKKRMEQGKLGARSYDWFTDIQLVKNTSKVEFNHPCPVPVELIERILLLATDENDVILDPFMGSGTTAIACMNVGREFIGFELDPTYYEMAVQRISEHLK